MVPEESEASEPPVLIDASALIALLGDEPAAGEVREILERSAAMTTLDLAETVDRLQRRYGLQSERTRPVIEGLLDEALTLLSLGSSEAWRAGEIRAEHYHRTRCPLSLADAVLIASAGTDRRIASSDLHVLNVAASEGISIIALQDSQGRRPSVERPEGR